MKLHRVTVEKLLIAAVFLLAICIRLLYLGTTPLSDGEATWALQSLDIARGDPVEIGPQVSYITLTGGALYLFGSSDFAARIWPAIAGSLLVLVPLFFRRALDAPATLILMVCLALDPGLVVASRLAGGPMMALGFGLLALGLAYTRRPVLAGISAGLAVLSGPAVIVGALSLLLAWIVARLVSGNAVSESNATPAEDPRSSWLTNQEWAKLLLSAGATLLVVGTLLLRYPQGLAAWIGSLPAYLQGWSEVSTVPPLRLIVALLVYQPLALIFGGIAAVRGWLRRDRLARILSLWFVFSLLLILIYPARQVIDLVWVLPPLWALAAMELAHDMHAARSNRLVAAGEAAVVFLLLAIFWLNLAGTSMALVGVESYILRFGVLAGLLALIAVTAILVGLGWSWEAARAGVVWGLCAGLGLYGISVMWSASFRSEPGRLDLWQPAPITRNADLLLKTVDDLSEWNTGLISAIDLTLAAEAPSLRWTLRNYPKMTTISEDQLASLPGAPAIVIARQTAAAPGLAEAYRGQDFAWWVYPGWERALPPDFLRWLTTRQAPLRQDQVLLWARSDLFPGDESTLDTAPVDVPAPEEENKQ
jgi:hypothetical protein